MYSADLLNHDNLLQHFGSYVNKDKSVNSDEFLFNATIVVMNIHKIRMLNALCFTQMQNVKEDLTLKNNKIIIWSPAMIELLTIIPSSLSALIVMQNKIFPLLQTLLGSKQSLPSSLREVVNSLHKYHVPEPIKQKTLLYWQDNGLTIRQYRDIAEHHYELLAQFYYQFIPIEKVLIYLPDNPSEKNYRKYTFNKEIDCIEYLEKSLKMVCEYVDSIWSDLGFTSEAIQQTFNPTQIDTEEGVRKTLGVMFYDSQGLMGLEIGQLEDRRLSFKQFNYLKPSPDKA